MDKIKKEMIVVLKFLHSFKRRVIKPLFFLALTFLSFSVFSQTDTSWVNPEHKQDRYPGIKTGWFIGADFGATLFYGDVALYNNFPKFKDFKQSFGNGYSFYGGKKFRHGLTAEAQIFKGNLTGMKVADKLYPRYFIADIMDYSVSLKYNLSQELFREIQRRKFFNRLTLFATVGVGQVFFRSRLYKLANNNQWYLEKVNGFSSTGIDSAGINRAGGLIAQKTKMLSAIIIPVGGKINFKLNTKTDIAFDLRYVVVFSDKIDSWERSWTHYDRYLYMGVGLVYNFGRKSEQDIPGKQRLLEKDTEKTNNGSPDDILPGNEKPVKKGLFKRKSKKVDKDLELRLKMYELQLKLFEMQYLGN